MSTKKVLLTKEKLEAILTRLEVDRDSQHQLVRTFTMRDHHPLESLREFEEILRRVAEAVEPARDLDSDPIVYIQTYGRNSLRVEWGPSFLRERLGTASPPTPLATALNSPLEPLRHLLQTRFPVLYAQVLEPTLADLREEHSAALADGRPLKARCILLQGYGALAAAAVCQLGLSLLGRIKALWKARSPK